jgi:hypothetical protein
VTSQALTAVYQAPFPLAGVARSPSLEKPGSTVAPPPSLGSSSSAQASAEQKKAPAKSKQTAPAATPTTAAPTATTPAPAQPPPASSSEDGGGGGLSPKAIVGLALAALALALWGGWILYRRRGWLP